MACLSLFLTDIRSYKYTHSHTLICTRKAERVGQPLSCRHDALFLKQLDMAGYLGFLHIFIALKAMSNRG